MEGILEALQGGLGSGLSALGGIAMIWGLAELAFGFFEMRSEYRVRGTLLFSAGALLAAIKTVAATIFK